MDGEENTDPPQVQPDPKEDVQDQPADAPAEGVTAEAEAANDENQAAEQPAEGDQPNEPNEAETPAEPDTQPEANNDEKSAHNDAEQPVEAEVQNQEGDNLAPEGQTEDPMNASPQIKDEEPAKLEQPLNGAEGSEHQAEDEQPEAMSSPDRDEAPAESSPGRDPPAESPPDVASPEGQAVYDRHQVDEGPYEGEGEQYQYNDDRAEMYNEQDDEETKRLYDGEGEDDLHHHMDPEGEGYVEEEEEEEEEDPLQKKINAIIELCEQTNGMYGDSEFPPNDASLYKNPAEPPDYAESTPVVEWMRPQEALKNGDDDKLDMIKDGIKPGDVKQGTLGDCWLLGAFMTLATHPELLQNLIVKNCIKHGFAVFQFFKNGEWKQVLVDTRIPYNRDSKTPLYGHCSDQTEVWVPLMEKAYAKLHGCYEALNGGSMVEALVDLTGGVSEKVILEDDGSDLQQLDHPLWKMMTKYHQLGYMLGCAKSEKDEDGNQEEGMGTQGILYNHAYGILDIRVALGIQLVRVRNPWGFGEWTGRYADEDEAWDDSKGLKDALNYVFEDDGTWWMRFDDWFHNNNRLYICKIFPDTWQQFAFSGHWEGNTAGGPYPPMVDRDETTGIHTRLDTNDKWFNNPQFRLSVHKKTQIYISLMQED